jgi:hypothetical protein
MVLNNLPLKEVRAFRKKLLENACELATFDRL